MTQRLFAAQQSMLRFPGFFPRYRRDAVATPRTLPEAAACGRRRGAVSCAFRLNLWPAVRSIPFEAAYCVTSRRNDSLGSRRRWQIFAALCAVSFGLAVAFAAFGAWLVLPYSVLEMVVLFLAFRWIGREAGERVPFGDDLSAAEREHAAKDLRRALPVC
jgi:hypothetical protein